MSKKCEICGKSRTFGNNRALVDGKPKRINVCTRCLRSGLVERPQFIKTTEEE